MEEEMIRIISALLGEKTSIDPNKIYNYLNENLNKKEKEQNEKVEELKKEVKDVLQNGRKSQDDEEYVIDFENVDKKKKLFKGLRKEKKTRRYTDELQEISTLEEFININKNAKIHVIADIKKNRYDILNDNGDIIFSRIINGVEKGMFKAGLNGNLVKIRRQQLINKYQYINKENVKRVDVITYKLLEDFDKEYSTNYAIKYLKLMTIDPHRKESESKEEYKRKVSNSKRKALNKLNIDFTYNTKGILFIKGVKLRDKIQYLKTASKQQEYAGAKVYGNFIGMFRNKNRLLDSAQNEEKLENEKKTLSLSKKKFPKMKFKSFQIPKINLNIDKKKAKGYFGRTVVAGIAALSLIGGIFKNNSNSYEQPSKQSNIELAMDTNFEEQDVASLKRQEFRNYQSQQDARKKFTDSLQSVAPQEQVENVENVENMESQIQETTEKVEENSIMQQINDLLNNEWKITEGRYYSSPDGTGNSGRFENHQGIVKVDFVNLLDENGRKISTISLEDLGTLPEDIKEQVKSFQYHVSNESTTLGWNTDKQLDELKANNSIQNVEEENDIER